MPSEIARVAVCVGRPEERREGLRDINPLTFPSVVQISFGSAVIAEMRERCRQWLTSRYPFFDSGPVRMGIKRIFAVSDKIVPAAETLKFETSTAS